MEEKFLVDPFFAAAADLAVRFGWYVLTALLSAVAGGLGGMLGTLWFGRGYRGRIKTLEKTPIFVDNRQ